MIEVHEVAVATLSALLRAFWINASTRSGVTGNSVMRGWRASIALAYRLDATIAIEKQIERSHVADHQVAI